MILNVSGIPIETDAVRPSSPCAAKVILAHPHPQMGGTMENKVIQQLFRRGQSRGWGMVRFNFRGVGGSGGTYDQGNGETEDLLSVLKWAAETWDVPVSDFTLCGYSFGAWICARAAMKLEQLKRVVLIAPPVGRADFAALKGLPHRKEIFAAGRDSVVPLVELKAWVEGLPEPKRLTVLSEADHLFVGSTTELVKKVLQTIDET